MLINLCVHARAHTDAHLPALTQPDLDPPFISVAPLPILK